MPPHLHQYLSLQCTDRVRINLKGKAYVMLMDDQNYASFLSGRDFEYSGRLVKRSPCLLSAPATGRWHLVIEQADQYSDVTAHVQIIRGN